MNNLTLIIDVLYFLAIVMMVAGVYAIGTFVCDYVIPYWKDRR